VWPSIRPALISAAAIACEPGISSAGGKEVPQPAEVESAPALVRGEPAEAGFSPQRLRRIGEFLTAEIERARMPGAVVGITRGGRLAYLEAFGYRDKARGIPMTADTLFWIASMTKPLTAAAALTLIERGRLVLDAEVGEYLPQFAGMRVARLTAYPASTGTVVTRPPDRQPTVLDLLRHTAGIPEGLLGDSPVHALYADAVGTGMTDLTSDEFADRLSRLPLLHEPGTMWHYGFGLDLTGFMIESITGMTLEAYMNEQLTAPLGMIDTTFGLPEDKQERYAAALPTDAVTGEPQVLPDLSIARFHSGGAGLISTATDYLTFVQFLLDKGRGGRRQLLGRKSVEYMLSDQLASGTDVSRLERQGWNPDHGFGLGVAVRRRLGGWSGLGSVGEVTWVGAAGTYWWADPHEDLGVVFLTHTPSRIQSRYHQIVRTLVLQALVE
jgi:CubicO group peptidase (beta-lactamase class C family)